MKLLIFVLCLIPSLALADQVDPTFVPPTWLQSILLWLKDLPYVGPVLVEVFKWSGVIASIMTALTACFIAITQALLKVLDVAKLVSLSLQVKALSDKVLPYLMYLSMFNAPKIEKK